MLRFVVMLCLICVANTGQAEGLLKRIFGSNSQYGSSCPGGKCPTAGNWSNNDGLSAREHVEQVHGVNTAGMSAADIQQHQNDYHNQYGSGHPVRGIVNAVVSVPRMVREQVASNYGPSPSSVGNGSFGGGSSGGFAVGKMYKGEMVTSIGESKPVPELAPVLPSEAKMVVGGVLDNMRARRAFRKVATEAAQRKLDAGEWTKEQFDNFTFAIYVPRIADEMRESLEAKVVADGAFGSAQAVNWENIERMIELVIKYLPMLLKLFADNSEQMAPVTINAAPYVISEKSPPSVYELLYGDIAA